MTNSILLTIKKMLGVSEEYHAFDLDIIININAVFLTLNQIGIGPSLPYQLPLVSEDSVNENPAVTPTWDDFLGDQKEYLAAVQTYVYQRVRLLFDPPTNSFLVSALQDSCKEFEWRFTVQPKNEKEVLYVESFETASSSSGEVNPPDEEFGGNESDVEPALPDIGTNESYGISIQSMSGAVHSGKPSLFDIFSI